MRLRTILGSAVLAVGMASLAAPTAFADMASADAAPTAPVTPIAGVPARTQITFQTAIPGLRLATPNEHDARPALSIIKLYIADFALRRGDHSASDTALAERMIRFSDDNAAAQMFAKYPNSIDAEAAEYHLTSTSTGDDWGSSYTSTADVASFLQAKRSTDANSPILAWMANPGKVAADGTVQNWGTVNLPLVNGTKWGWSDYGPQQVASASYGPFFSVAAQTAGGPADQTADVLAALPQLLLGAITGR